MFYRIRIGGLNAAFYTSVLFSLQLKAIPNNCRGSVSALKILSEYNSPSEVHDLCFPSVTVLTVDVTENHQVSICTLEIEKHQSN